MTHEKKKIIFIDEDTLTLKNGEVIDDEADRWNKEEISCWLLSFCHVLEKKDEWRKEWARSGRRCSAQRNHQGNYRGCSLWLSLSPDEGLRRSQMVR